MREATHMHMRTRAIPTRAPATPRPRIADSTDLLWYAALALLPVDGLVWGVRMPYYSPVSPVLFALYAACNIRHWPCVARRFPAMAPLVAALVCVSGFGWLTAGFDRAAAATTGLAVLFAMCTLASFAIAWSCKRLDRRTAVTVLAWAYGIAFLVGVGTWLAQPDHLDVARLREALMPAYLRQYFVARPQFLFAEPSYIGMHLFGVLLPLHWVTRDRRLPVVVCGFAAGALLMGSGVRIMLDTLVAAALWAAAARPWRLLPRRRRRFAFAGLALGGLALIAMMGAALATQPRVRALASRGLFAGDTSMSARIFRSMLPLEAGWHDWPHLLLGHGAGNLAEAMRAGWPWTMDWYRAHGGMTTGEIMELADPTGPTANLAGNVFTMDAYATFVAEFGLVMAAVAAALLLRHVTRHRAWNRLTVCWLLLLVYLYAQFEAYAFPALWLFVWAVTDREAMDRVARSPCVDVRSTQGAGAARADDATAHDADAKDTDRTETDAPDALQEGATR